MNYQRILMLIDLGADPQPACEAIRRFAPSATQVTVIAQQPPRLLAWVTPAAPPDLNDAARRALDDLRQAAEGTAAAVECGARVGADCGGAGRCRGHLRHRPRGSRLAVPLRTLSMVAELRKRSSVPVLCVRSAPASSGPEGGNRMLCVGLSSRGRAAVVRLHPGSCQPAGSSRAPVVRTAVVRGPAPAA